MQPGTHYDFIRLPVGLRDEPFFLTYLVSCLEQVLLRLAFLIKFFQQDLPSSLSKPISESCRLHNGRHAAGKQVSAALDSHFRRIKCFCLTTFVISLLHQRFIFIHLSDTYLPASAGLFPNRSPPLSYDTGSIGWFDCPACTVQPMGR